MTKEIRISGSGGQGVVLAGIILAEAAGIFEDKYVIQVQDYGSAMRGGAVRSAGTCTVHQRWYSRFFEPLHFQ